MHRKKRTDRKDAGPGAFANKPFRELKGLKTAASAQAMPSAPPKTQPTADPAGDEALFLREVRNVRRVAAGDADADAPSIAAPPSPAADPALDDESGRMLFLQAMGSLPATEQEDEPDNDADSGQRRSASGRMRQLRKGTIRISEELDLHGFLKDEALRRLGTFIAGAHLRGAQAVLVITGKGLNSPEGPVLPAAAASWLREQGKGMVAEFHAAPRDKGGSGALVVFLKQGRR